MGLVLKTGKAKADRAHGKPIADYGIKDANGNLIKSVSYDVKWYEYEDEKSMQEAHDELTLKEQLKVRNVEKKTTARQAANTAALDALGIVKPNEETDSQIRLKAVYKGFYGKLIEKGIPAEEARVQARAKASEMLEEAWEDEDEEE